MKKLLLTALLCALSFTTARAAESAFDAAGAFVVAKAVKLGRGKAYKIQSGQSFGSQTEFQQEISCGDHCADCDKTTGKCRKCDNGWLLDNGICTICPEHASCDGSDVFSCDSYYVKDRGECVGVCAAKTCDTGYKPVAYANECRCEAERQPCKAGTYVNTSDGSCTPCPKGTYGTGTDAATCVSCPSGQTTASTGSTSMSACYTPSSDSGSSSSCDKCSPSPAGNYTSGRVCFLGSDAAYNAWLASGGCCYNVSCTTVTSGYVCKVDSSGKLIGYGCSKL